MLTKSDESSRSLRPTKSDPYPIRVILCNYGQYNHDIISRVRRIAVTEVASSDMAQPVFLRFSGLLVWLNSDINLNFFPSVEAYYKHNNSAPCEFPCSFSVNALEVVPSETFLEIVESKLYNA